MGRPGGSQWPTASAALPPHRRGQAGAGCSCGPGTRSSSFITEAWGGLIIDSLQSLSWASLLMAMLVFGFAPGLVLRIIVLAFERDDPRRRELLAELYAVPRLERPLWVAEQLEVALSEGV